MSQWDGCQFFAGTHISSALAARTEKMRKAARDWSADEVLATSETDIVNYLVQTHTLECPVLDRAGIEIDDQSERTARWEDHVGWHERPQTRMVFAVPFTGDSKVFDLNPGTYMAKFWTARVRDQELLIEWEGESGNSAAARRHVDSYLDDFDVHLDRSRPQIEKYNASLRGLAETWVAERKAKVLKDRNMEAELGFPIRRRQGAATYPVSVRRKATIKPVKPKATSAFRPEPALDTADYEEALRILASSRNGLERMSSSVAHLGEEDIRNLLLNNLNTAFEGTAGGELFNGNGKTDLLIRERDRNVFIGECKIWKGSKPLGDAVDQLLGYMAWRDTKGALLVFVRSGNPGEITDKAVKVLSEHAACKHVVAGGTAERHDFVFGSTHDSNCDIQLALMVFHLPTPS